MSHEFVEIRKGRWTRCDKNSLEFWKTITDYHGTEKYHPNILTKYLSIPGVYKAGDIEKMKIFTGIS